MADIKSRTSLTALIAKVAGTRFLPNSGSGAKGLCPFHDEKTPSFNVRDHEGYYHCFGCGASGDVFKFLVDHEGLKFTEAVRYAADFAGVQPPDSLRRVLEQGRSPPASSRKRKPVLERPPSPRPFIYPPQGAPPLVDASGRATAWRILGTRLPRETTVYPSAVYAYRDPDGRPMGYVLRIDRQAGKTFLQVTWCDPAQEPAIAPADGEMPPSARWVMRGFPEGPRPIYGAHNVGSAARAGDHIDGLLVVEGEKAQEAGQFLLDQQEEARWLVLSPCGGLNAVSMMDWATLADPLERLAQVRASPIPIVAWPDADRLLPGRNGRAPIDRQAQFCSGFLAGLERAAEKRSAPLSIVPLFVTPPEGVSDGWDVADAKDEGWTADDVLDLLRSSVGTEAVVPLSADGDPVGRLYGADMADDEGRADGDASNGLQQVDQPDDPSADEAEPDLDMDRDHPAPSADQELMTQHIRALGYDGGRFYLLPRATGQISIVSPQQLTRQALMSFVSYDDWQALFPADKSQRSPVDWDRSVNAILEACRSAGVWDGFREMRHGARMDGGRVVFNSGSKLWVEGVGQNVSLFEMTGENVYTRAHDFGHPDFENAFSADDPDLCTYIDVVRSLAWRRDTEALSVMVLVGWLAVAPLCGLLSWRPHLWLDGPSGAGKSWILSNIIKPVLGRYLFSVDSTTTEPGLRRNLHASSIPVSFDEAESDGKQSRQRWEAILNLVRTAAASRGSRVVQGDGTYFVNACFLFTSIVPQLRKTADVTRFARVSLGPPLPYSQFEARIASPAEELLASGEFSRRFLARVVQRSPALKQTQKAIIEALSREGLARRIADVYGTLAAGYWLVTQDGTLSSAADAAKWLAEQGVTRSIVDAAAAAAEHQDHVDLLNTILATSVRVDASGQSSYATISALVRRVAGLSEQDEHPYPETVAEAAIKPYGLRLHRREAALGGMEGAPPGLIIHRNWPRVRELLADTSYTGTYDAVLLQAPGARVVESPVRFEGVTNRGIYIPLATLFPGLDAPSVCEKQNLEGI
ncbi:hypothetical protein HNS03_18915 [Amorphus sp. 3PC139-8]